MTDEQRQRFCIIHKLTYSELRCGELVGPWQIYAGIDDDDERRALDNKFTNKIEKLRRRSV